MSAPAGHNPEVSMLQGGNAAITPMQGGGIVPPGYSGESMLQGGTAPITPMQGGFAPAPPGYSGESMLQGGTAPILPMQGGDPPRPITQEEQQLLDNFKQVFDLFPKEKKDEIGQRLLKESEGKSEADKLDIFLTIAREYTPTGPPVAPMNPEASNDPPDVSTLRSQLPSTKGAKPVPTQPTVAAPPIRKLPIEVYRISNPVGRAREHEVYTYLRAKEFLQAHDMEFRNRLLDQLAVYEARRAKAWPTVQARAPTLPLAGQQIRPGDIVLSQYSRGIYTLPAETKTVIAVSPIQGDTNLLIDVLGQLERYNILEVTNGKIVVKAEKTVIAFMPPFYAKPVVDDKDNRNKNITLFSIFLDIEANNPDKIFVLAEHTSNNFNVGEVFYEYRGNRRAKLFPNFLEPTYIVDVGANLVLSGAAAGEPALPITPADKQYPPWVRGVASDAQPLPAKSWQLTIRSLGEKNPFPLPKGGDNTGGCEYFRGYLDAEGEVALIAQPDTNKLNEEISANHIFAIRLDSSPTRICEGAHVTEDGEYISPTQFHAANPETLKSAGAPTTPIEFVDKDEPNRTIYQIRKPQMDNGVFDDWNNGRYTADEAAFLNSLDIFPNMLEEIFTETRWQTEVAFFLQSIAISRCYTDDTLLLKRECEFNRKFLERIYDFFITEDLTLDRRRQLRDLEEKAELAEYQRLIKEGAQHDEEKAKAVPTGDFESIPRTKFHKTKRAFGTLFMYDLVDKTGTYKAANFMLINQATGAVSYHRIKATMEEYTKEPRVLINKIDTIKTQHEGVFFVVY